MSPRLNQLGELINKTFIEFNLLMENIDEIKAVILEAYEKYKNKKDFPMSKSNMSKILHQNLNNNNITTEVDLQIDNTKTLNKRKTSSTNLFSDTSSKNIIAKKYDKKKRK